MSSDTKWYVLMGKSFPAWEGELTTHEGELIDGVLGGIDEAYGNCLAYPHLTLKDECDNEDQPTNSSGRN